MIPAVNTDLRLQLVDWRERLESSITVSNENTHLSRLLIELNRTLDHMSHGSYGVCEACEGAIEEPQLISDPLSRFCLSCLNDAQLDALGRDLEKARQVQGEMLPKQNLNVGSWEVAYHYDAAGPVSGDYCDLVSLESGALFFLLGDVSGKGVASSLLMSHLRATFRSFITLGLSVDELVKRANEVFCGSTMSAYYATLVCGIADRYGEVEICNAGHCPPLLVKKGVVTGIEATGHPVGLFCNAEYSMTKMQLAAGDSLFLYTDGLSEALDPFDSEYGTERLTELLSLHHALPSQQLIHTCLQDVTDFRSGRDKTDDLTIMAVSRVRV